jgi:hypothetical protein
MKQVVLGLVLTLAAGTAAAQSNPATIVAVDGDAMVGSTTVASGKSFGANVGDVVTVNGGTAKVTYSNGCTVTVDANSSYTIADKAPVCRSPAVAASSDTRYYLMAGGAAALLVAGAAGGGGGDDKPSSP